MDTWTECIWILTTRPPKQVRWVDSNTNDLKKNKSCCFSQANIVMGISQFLLTKGNLLVLSESLLSVRMIYHWLRGFKPFQKNSSTRQLFRNRKSAEDESPSRSPPAILKSCFLALSNRKKTKGTTEERARLTRTCCFQTLYFWIPPKAVVLRAWFVLSCFEHRNTNHHCHTWFQNHQSCLD